ncbi:MAG: ATP-dependent helicase [Candidatus Bipolaricaulis sp.]|nr:ATP-dependent helicase [Candidatus Bipolaricaulis sp.]
MAHDSWLDELNAAQRAAVTHGDGPLLVVAGAGTGKTKTLAYRVAYLISRGVDPGRILLLTFTRRAAQEMLERASTIVARGASSAGRVWGGTFHSMAHRLLRLYAPSIGIARDFTVLDQGDAENLIHLIRHEMGLHEKEKRFPRKGTCLAVYSRCVNSGDDLKAVLERDFPWCDEWEEELRTLFKKYVVRKQDRNVLDYDDLLLYWKALLDVPGLADEIGGRFDHVLVDEYQDTNIVQARILLGMRKACRNLMVVGDDAQSIYAFRGATVRNMLDFPTQFPGATIVKLEQNYRSVLPILDTANRLIAGANERFAKDLWSERKSTSRPKLVTCKDATEQDEYVVDAVLRHYEEGIPLRRQAVLFRASHLSDTLEVELARRNIPYHKYGGLRFLEAAHVKDLLAFLRVLENPRDELAWFRVLELLDGVGPTTASRVVEHVGQSGNDPRAVRSFGGSPAARAGLADLADVFDDLVPLGPKNPEAQVERIRRFYDPLFERTYENPAARVRDLISLEQIAGGYRSRHQFLADVQLDPPTSTSDLAGAPYLDEDWLVLSTIHSAKGCEWDVVYLIHAADGFLPSDLSTGSQDEIEEERRLVYVALTRAKDRLYITWPLRYYHKWYALGDDHSYAQLCRFFTKDVLDTVEDVALAAPEEKDDGGSFYDVDADVRQRMRDMWE